MTDVTPDHALETDAAPPLAEMTAMDWERAALDWGEPLEPEAAACPPDLLPDHTLLALARAAGLAAYVPYSHFRVGAVVVAGGKIYTGCNVENASYGLTICAERVAACAAVQDGHRRFERVAVSCLDAPDTAPASARMPCGACRQFLREFTAPEVEILIDGVGCRTMEAIFPDGFVPPIGLLGA